LTGLLTAKVARFAPPIVRPLVIDTAQSGIDTSQRPVHAKGTYARLPPSGRLANSSTVDQ